MCPPGYHNNGFVATHALGYLMYNIATVHHVPKCVSYHRDDCIYIYIYIYINLTPIPAFF